MNNKTSWGQLLRRICSEIGVDFGEVTSTLTNEEMNRQFDGGYGGSEGTPFTAWSRDWVFFPVVYDGSEWVGYAPRNPCDIKTKHQGGE